MGSLGEGKVKSVAYGERFMLLELKINASTLALKEVAPL